MLRMRTWMNVALVVLGIGAACTTQADVRNPVKIRIKTDGLTPARTGETYSGVLEVTAPRGGILERVEVGGNGWQPVEVKLATPVVLRPREAVEVPFEALALDADQKLEVRAIVDGEMAQKRFSLHEKHMAQIGRPRPVVRVDPPDSATSAPTTIPQGGIAGCDDRLIRVRGRFEYVRFDGQTIGADGLHFRIMDEDTGPDELMFESYTDTNGYFDVTICWDDCDISGCDDPDIYIHFDCETGVAIVRNDDAGEDTYAWSTEDSQLYEDYTGNDLNFGNIRPAFGGDYTAVHIHNSIMRSHRFVLEHNGHYIPQVIVVWQDNNGAFYSSSQQEIHIGPDEQWNEGTQIHEWGHHLLFIWTDPLDPDYCNGFCDDPNVGNCGMEACIGGGGHCIWCAETDHDAWNEGFPDWLAGVVQRQWVARYGGPAPFSITDGRWMHETTGTCCDGAAHNALTTEGFIAALLQDIEDPPQDPGQTSCPQDSIEMGPDEILVVVRQARPVRVMEFMTAFRAAYPHLEFDLRSTAAAVSPAYVAGWPIPTIAIQDTSGCSTVGIGDTITLQVQTNASRYSTCMRWQRDGVDVANGGRISGADTETLTIANAQVGDAGRYTFVIRSCDGTPNPCDTNASQTVTSAVMHVHVFGNAGPGHRIAGWGRNENGQLGRGSAVPASDVNPAEVIDLTNAVKVVAGYFRSAAILADGSAWCWGNTYLGNGTGSTSATPVRVNFLTDVVDIATDGWQTSMALDARGHVWTWGSNYTGHLGYSQPSGFTLNPGQVNLDCVVDIAMGRYHSAAVTSDGSLWMWGSNAFGELGQGYNGGSSQLPVRVTDLSDVVAVDCGHSHTLALRTDGTLWACGWNQYGQLGDGTLVSRNRFVQVVGLANVAGMSAGDYHSVARLANGQAWAWGANGSYQLGTNGPLTNIPTPAQVVNVGAVRDISAGESMTAYIANDGTIWTGGSNYAGQLCRPNPTTNEGYLPAPVDARVGAGVRVSAGSSHVLAIAPGARIPAIIESQLVAGNATARFHVDAVGEPPINYQWGRNVGGLFAPFSADGGPISGTTTPTLMISPTELIHSDFYQVRVSNATNTVFSNVIRLSTPPYLNGFSAPSDVSDWWSNDRGNWAVVDGAYEAGSPTVYPGSYSAFRLPQTDFMVELDVVQASHLNFDINGAIWLRSEFTSAFLYPRGVALTFGDTWPWGAGDLYWYRSYGGGYGGAQNIAQSVYAAGQTLHLRIEVRGNTYTAWANDSPTPTTTLVTPDFPAGRIGLLDAVAAGTAFDNIFVQTLTDCEPGSGIEPVRIIQRPQSQSVPSGTNVMLSVGVTGGGALSYQWLRGGLRINGATAPTYSFTASSATAGRYECTVTNVCGAVGSYPAFITVAAAGAGPGDLNCDNSLNNFDIDAFVLALIDPAGYVALYPGCDILNADVDGDGAVTNFDIDPFVQLLVGG
ncbi:MAG: hypothetical protein HRU75_05205 [Planctomycetia bacterium]|nr:MAG: hypothetical protein HRU75_05205 [Planctomycetia bacterium]